MGWRPKWRLQIGWGGVPHELSERFKASWADNYARQVKCTATARGTGKTCRAVAMRGTTRCCHHKGLDAAAKAEAERFGRPVIILRKTRNRAIEKLGNGPWPEGLPHRPDLDALSPRTRGMLFEAWENRLTAPEVWQREWTRKRTRMVWDKELQAWFNRPL